MQYGWKRLFVILLILIFGLSPVLFNSFALDKIEAKADDKAVLDEAPEGSQVNPKYRQELGKVIAPREEFFPFELDAYTRFMGPSGAGSQSGKIGIIDSAAEYSYEFKAFGELPVQFGVFSRYIGIKNTTVVELPSHLTSVGFGAETAFPFFNVDKTYFSIALAPTFYSDNWNFNSSTFSLLQRYFFIYKPNEKWVFICGAEYSPRYKDPVSPILGFIYTPNDRLTFNIVPESPEISYAVNDKLKIFIQGDGTFNEYWVKKDGIKNTALEYNEMHLGTGLRFKLNKYITGSFIAGGIFNRSIKYRHDELGKVKVKDGYYTEFHFVISF